MSSFRDIDGGGVANERKTLVEGFGRGIRHPRGADHAANGVRMGIDGWLSLGVGDYGMPDAKGADGTRHTPELRILVKNRINIISLKLGEHVEKVADSTPAEVLAFAVKNKGNARTGGTTYSARGGIACHSVDPDAERKGPYLGSAGAKFSRECLIEFLVSLNPSELELNRGFANPRALSLPSRRWTVTSAPAVAINGPVVQWIGRWPPKP